MFPELPGPSPLLTLRQASISLGTAGEKVLSSLLAPVSSPYWASQDLLRLREEGRKAAGRWGTWGHIPLLGCSLIQW